METNFFQYSGSAVEAIGYYGEAGHSNTPSLKTGSSTVLLLYYGTAEPTVSDPRHAGRAWFSVLKYKERTYAMGI